MNTEEKIKVISEAVEAALKTSHDYLTSYEKAEVIELVDSLTGSMDLFNGTIKG